MMPMGKAGCELEETGGNEKDFIKLKNMLLKGSQAIAKPQPVWPCRNGVLVNLDVYMKSPKFPLLAKLFFFFFLTTLYIIDGICPWIEIGPRTTSL